MDIIKVANLARLDLTEKEVAEFGPQLTQILKHIDQLNQIDVEGIEPTAHAAAVFDVYREDEEQPERTLSQEDVLGNAPATAHEQIKMPKVIE
jgi:aspartyl-tRNA(Asn)/glutamyl-tRNA(Gln) amidotransferase subunit C